MTTLSSAMNLALSGLSLTSAQSALVSRNVARAGDENYTRRSAGIHTLPGGMPVLAAPQRSTDGQLLGRLLSATGHAAGADVMAQALARLSATVGDPQDDTSLAAGLGRLRDALSLHESDPANSALGAAAVDAARSVAQQLNVISEEVSGLMSSAERDMAASAATVNSLLSQFKAVNDSVVRGEGTPDELAEALDERDRIVKLLSAEIGIRTAVRSRNDMMIYAEGGAVLFEGRAREVSLRNGPAGETAIYADGAAIIGPDATMPVTSGRLVALARLAGDVLPAYLKQADSIAAGLVRNFSEAAQPPSVLPDAPGLFIDPAGGLPAAGTAVAGLAGRIALNPQAVGNPELLRDGGFGGAAYVANSTGAAGYQGRLSMLVASFDSTIPFGSGTGLPQSATLLDYGALSAGWVEAKRQAAEKDSTAAHTARARTGEALERVTGVSIDHEMSVLLDLEKSYQASSKIIAVIDGMLATLMDAVR